MSHRRNMHERIRAQREVARESKAAKESARRRRFVLLTGLAVVIAVGGIYLAKSDRRPSREPVLLVDRSGIDSEVLAVLDAQVAVVRKDPASAEAHGVLGWAYELNELYEPAEKCHAIAVSLDPADPVWPLHRSICLRELGQSEPADELLKRIVAEFPNFAQAIHRLGEVALLQGDLDMAARHFKRTIDLKPQFPGGHVGLVEVKVRTKDYQEARRLAETAIAISPTAASAHYVLGLALRGLGDAEAAKRELAIGAGAKSRYLPDRLTDMAPRFEVGTKSVLANASRLRDSGRSGDAVQILEAALNRRPNDYILMNNLATLYLDTNRPQNAKELLSRAVEVDPGNFGAYINLATCCIRINELDIALAHADRAIAIAPNVGAAHMARGDVLTVMRRYDEALASLRQSAQLDARSAEPFQKQGDIYIMLRRWEEARQMYEAAVKLAPQLLAGHLNRGAAALVVGRIGEAMECLRAAEGIDPSNPKVAALRDRLAKADAAE